MGRGAGDRNGARPSHRAPRTRSRGTPSQVVHGAGLTDSVRPSRCAILSCALNASTWRSNGVASSARRVLSSPHYSGSWTVCFVGGSGLRAGTGPPQAAHRTQEMSSPPAPPPRHMSRSSDSLLTWPQPRHGTCSQSSGTKSPSDPTPPRQRRPWALAAGAGSIGPPNPRAARTPPRDARHSSVSGPGRAGWRAPPPCPSRLRQQT